MIKKQCNKGFCDNDANICFCDMFQYSDKSLKQSNTNKEGFTHKKVKNPCGKSLKINDTMETTEYKTICLSCKSRFIKNKWLFDYCPVCKSKNLIGVEI